MDNKVTITVNAKDLASTVLDKTNKNVDDLGNNVSQASKKAWGASRGFRALKTAVVGFLTVQTLRTVGDLATKAAKFDDIAVGFKRSFGDMEGSLKDLREASRGTISDMDLMLAANKAALLGVTDNSEKLAGVMQTAILRGKELGISTTQAFDDIVTGIGRGSPLILDNLGIKIPGALKKSMEGMSDAKKTQALLNFAIKDGVELSKQYAGATESSTDKIARMQAKLDNLTTRLGKVFLPIFEGFVDTVASLTDEILKFAKSMERALSNAEETKRVVKAPSMSEHKRMSILDMVTNNQGQRFSSMVGKDKRFPTSVEAIKFLQSSGRVSQAGGKTTVDGKELAFAKGGSFVTNGPQRILVGDNPGGREHVEVTPLDGMGRGSSKKGANITNNFYNSANPQMVATYLGNQINMLGM